MNIFGFKFLTPKETLNDWFNGDYATYPIDWSDLKEGDLIFFKTDASRSISHVGIYMTNNKFAHASTSQGVTISDLSEPYWQKRLYSLGRVLKN